MSGGVILLTKKVDGRKVIIEGTNKVVVPVTVTIGDYGNRLLNMKSKLFIKQEVW
jgi:hypothetical protein